MSGLPAPSRSTFEETWTSAAPYLSKPLAAAGAIVPVNYGFEIKSAQQTGESIPKLNITALKRGFLAAPLAGAAIGTQMISQEAIERVLKSKQSDTQSYSAKLMSSAVVGVSSSPAYIVLNGHFLNMSPKKSLMQSSLRQVAAISGRETCFVLSLSLSTPIADQMKKLLGNRTEIETSAAFVSGAMGSIAGHGFDTWLTCDQKKVPIESLRNLARGSLVKAISTGLFAVLYDSIQNFLDPKSY
ncbi:MAG: hypothetical protein S4CHLAM7_01940 [Chlamydiae bacterium]|nr:hypothetical protein [Chlamydiota bacterium]